MATIEKIIGILRGDPTYTPLSDVDAATRMSAPSKVSRPGRLTFTGLGDTWGADRAAQFKGWLRGAIAKGQAVAPTATDQQTGALCDYILGLLDGPGLDYSHPDTIAKAAQLVSAGACTQAESDQALYLLSYPADGVVADTNIHLARAIMAHQDNVAMLQGKMMAAQASLGSLYATYTTNLKKDPVNTVPLAWADLEAAYKA